MDCPSEVKKIEDEETRYSLYPLWIGGLQEVSVGPLQLGLAA